MKEIFEKRKDAELFAYGNPVLTVDGGFEIVSWSEYYFRLSEEARSLYSGGWKAEDREQLIEEYGYTSQEADEITSQLEELEEEETEKELDFVDEINKPFSYFLY